MATVGYDTPREARDLRAVAAGVIEQADDVDALEAFQPGRRAIGGGLDREERALAAEGGRAGRGSEPAAPVITARSRGFGARARCHEPAVSVSPTDSLLDAAKLMVDHQIRHLPVVEDNAVVGMLSDRDIRTVAGDPVRYVETRERDGAPLSVRDAMASTARTIHANRPLHDVANELADERIGALPVIDADGKLLGIVSYVDALRALAP